MSAQDQQAQAVSPREHRRAPPTVRGLRLLGVMPELSSDPLGLYGRAWREHGDLVRLRALPGVHFDLLARLPAKSVFVLAQFLIHRHPEFWDEPDAFRPGRFLGDPPIERARFAYFPFGGGPRVCIGAQFATIEATLALATVAQRYGMDLVPGHPVIPDPTFTLRPRYGVKVVLRRRG